MSGASLAEHMQLDSKSSCLWRQQDLAPDSNLPSQMTDIDPKNLTLTFMLGILVQLITL